MNDQFLINAIESILFVAGDAVEIPVIANAIDVEKEKLYPLIDQMIQQKENASSGILLIRVDDKIQLCSNAKYMPFIDKSLQPVKKSRLSQSLLETLSIIAYKQPVTRFEIEQIRGVKCNYSVATLIEKGLIQRAGRKKTLGNPIMYITSDEFLRHFGLSSLEELPPLNHSEA
ncbi:MAG: SMC-Scp complex subunit ScpB [Christensenellales bacterium]